MPVSRSRLSGALRKTLLERRSSPSQPDEKRGVEHRKAGLAHATGPSVTIVIPTRNRLPLLREAVSSVLGQSFVDWEAIVVDDCSTDSTWKWLSEINDARLRPIRLNDHSERSAARNSGLREAKGEFVLFLDDDDRLMPSALEYLMSWFMRRPDVMAVVGAKLIFDDRGHRRRCSHPAVPIRKSMREEAVLGWSPQLAQCAIRIEAVRDVGGWDSRLVPSEDYDLWLRLTRVGAAMLVPRVVLEYRAHAGQWRPLDAFSAEDQSREKFLSDVASDERERTARCICAHSLHRLASTQHAGGDLRQATFNYLRAIQVAPQVLCSPVTGPTLARNLIKAIVGTVLHRRLTRTAKQAKATIRDWLHRNPGATREVQIRSVNGSTRGGE